MPPRKRSTGTFGVVGMDTGRFADFSHSCLGVKLPPDWHYETVKNYSCAQACNYLAAERFQGERLLLMGDDHNFPRDLIARLEVHDVDIVAPFVLNRRAPFEPCMVRDDYPYWPEGPPGLIEVDETGTAGMLIHRRVFEALDFPYFRDGWIDGELMSDDTFFCRKARAAGFKIHVDTSVPMSHMAVLDVMPIYETDTGEWKAKLRVGEDELARIGRARAMA